METKVILSYFSYIIYFIFHKFGPTDLQISPAP